MGAVRSLEMQAVDERENSLDEMRKMRDEAWEENKQLKKQVIRENRAIADFQKLENENRQLTTEVFELRSRCKTQKLEIQMLKYRAKLLKALEKAD